MGLTLSDKIQKRLDERGKTVYWLAKEAGLGFGSVYPLLSGKRTEPTFSTMEKIADALDVSLDEFRSKEEVE